MPPHEHDAQHKLILPNRRSLALAAPAAGPIVVRLAPSLVRMGALSRLAVVAILVVVVWTMTLAVLSS
jgi:hypothetical protein